MGYAKEQIFFTAFIGLIMVAALFVAKDWPIRASIIILLLGSIGVVLALLQLRLDFKACARRGYQDPAPDIRGSGDRASRPLGQFRNLGVALGTFLRDSSNRLSRGAAVVCFPLRQAVRRRLVNRDTPDGSNLGFSLRRL